MYEYYYIPAAEIQTYSAGWVAEWFTVDRAAGTWVGIVGVFDPTVAPTLPWDAKMCNAAREKLRNDLRDGRLACFRINADGTPWQPAGVTVTSGLRPCINPSCTWKLGPDESVCCWCGAGGDHAR